MGEFPATTTTSGLFDAVDKIKINDSSTRMLRHWAIQPGSGLTSLALDGISTSPTVNGTGSAAHDADGQFINYLTSGVVDRDGGWLSSTFNQVRRRELPYFSIIIKTGSVAADLTNVRLQYGLFSASPVTNSNPTVHHASFRYATNVDGTAFWRIMSDNGSGSATITTSTVAVTTSTIYRLDIDMATSGQISYYINNSLIITHTTTLPDIDTDLGFCANIRNTAASSGVNIKLARMYMEHR